MIDEQTNKRICNAVLWFYAACLLVVMLTGCNPYDGVQIGTPTATAQPAATNLVSKDTRLTPTSQTCTVSTGVPAGNLNIRSGAGTSYAVIGLLREGEILTVITRGVPSSRDGATWLVVEVETAQHVTGWVNARYCR